MSVCGKNLFLSGNLCGTYGTVNYAIIVTVCGTGCAYGIFANCGKTGVTVSGNNVILICRVRTSCTRLECFPTYLSTCRRLGKVVIKKVSKRLDNDSLARENSVTSFASYDLIIATGSIAGRIYEVRCCGNGSVTNGCCAVCVTYGTNRGIYAICGSPAMSSCRKIVIIGVATYGTGVVCRPTGFSTSSGLAGIVNILVSKSGRNLLLGCGKLKSALCTIDSGVVCTGCGTGCGNNYNVNGMLGGEVVSDRRSFNVSGVITTGSLTSFVSEPTDYAGGLLSLVRKEIVTKFGNSNVFS